MSVLLVEEDTRLSATLAGTQRPARIAETATRQRASQRLPSDSP
ncbi:hypothetical protein [Mycobacterium nebraskense]|nr:hypothetical protein [Mycobacterium nebraskense]